MIVPKQSREVIAKAQGRTVEIDWPQGAPEPRVSRSYTVQSSHRRAGETRIEVWKREEVSADRWRVKVRVADEFNPCRMGARKGIEPDPYGGPQFRPEHEPEQVDRAFQRQLSQEGVAATTIHGNHQRERARESRAEAKLAKELRKGRPGNIARGTLQRSERRMSQGPALGSAV